MISTLKNINHGVITIFNENFFNITYSYHHRIRGMGSQENG